MDGSDRFIASLLNKWLSHRLAIGNLLWRNPGACTHGPWAEKNHGIDYEVIPGSYDNHSCCFPPTCPGIFTKWHWGMSKETCQQRRETFLSLEQHSCEGKMATLNCFFMYLHALLIYWPSVRTRWFEDRLGPIYSFRWEGNELSSAALTELSDDWALRLALISRNELSRCSESLVH